MQPIEFVRATPPFDRLPEEEVRRVVAALKIVRYPAGTRILRQGGEPSHCLYLIREGAVRLERDGRPVMVMEEGELFGFPSMLGRKPPLFDVITEEDSVIYQIPEALFRQLLQYADFAEFFLQGLSERLRRTAVSEPQALWGDLATPVRALVRRTPVFVSPETSVAEAARVMHETGISSVLVEAQPLGIVTMRDLRSRVLARARSPETPVREVMSAPLKTLPADTPIYGAMLFLMEENIHHLPLEEGGRVVGVVTDSDLLRHQVKNPLYLFERIRDLRDPAALREYADEVAGTVETMFRGGLDVTRIGRITAGLNDALTKRLLRLAEGRLGPPPVPYAWIVFGSEGRMEQTLLTDQDNALVYASEAPGVRDYFAELARLAVDGLIQAGFPPCSGGYMATNWCYPLEHWTALFRRWIETPEPAALMEAGIFFDFRKVHGGLDLAPLEAVCREAASRRIFLAHMARAARTFQPPLGFFRRIRDEGGKVNLKKGGIAPIVAMARVYALEAASSARSTPDRLEAAVAGGALSREGADMLLEAFRFLMRLRLREQLEAVRQGLPLENTVRLDRLTALERRHLKEAFLAIREMQEALALRYQTDMLG